MPEQLSIDGRPAVPCRPTYGTGEVFEVTPLFVAVASIRGQLALETDKERPAPREFRNHTLPLDDPRFPERRRFNGRCRKCKRSSSVLVPGKRETWHGRTYVSPVALRTGEGLVCPGVLWEQCECGGWIPHEPVAGHHERRRGVRPSLHERTRPQVRVLVRRPESRGGPRVAQGRLESQSPREVAGPPHGGLVSFLDDADKAGAQDPLSI